jgi:gluconokinase
MQTPVTDYKKTKGLVYFARMLDKIRLNSAGKLPPGYFLGVKDDPTHLDGRCVRFLRVDYDEITRRTLAGGSDEEILEWCYQTSGYRPNDEEILIFNAFVLKRGWRDESSEELEQVKRENGLGDRADIQTWVDFHDVDEGRQPGGQGSER